jgi:uncharacterized membrane protein (DUF2068 family)
VLSGERLRGAGGGRLAAVGPQGDERRRSGGQATVLGRPLPLILVVLEKAVSALLSLAGAALALLLHTRRAADPLRLLLPDEYAESPHDVWLRWLVHHLPALGPGTLLWVAGGLVFWGALLGAEAVGLWFGYGWGEFLIIVETAGFLPAEVYHLLRHPRGGAAITLVINLAILAYVGGLYRRRLAARPLGETLSHVAFGGRDCVEREDDEGQVAQAAGRR